MKKTLRQMRNEAIAADRALSTNHTTAALTPLYVAAPDLLAACEFVRKYADMKTGTDRELPGQLVSAITAAIAKAKGGA